MTDSVKPSALFALASLPARFVGRFRTDLAASVRADGAVFRGARSGLLLLLVLVAVGYPILTSFIHATITPQPEDTLFNWAITPWYTFTYSESIPFMVAVAVVGAFSPALGALLVTVLAPLDLVAAALAYGSGVEMEPLVPSIAGRLLSYLLLWILAVEVPLRARAWASRWAARRPSATDTATAAIFALAIGIGTFFWASSIGWLIVPVITWNTLGSEGAYVPLRMTEPSLAYSWIVALGAAVLAVAAGVVWSGRDKRLDQRPAPGGPQGLLGELLRLGLAAVLLSGLMKSFVEAAVIITGLVVAGPVLSRVLPRVRVPGFLAAIPAPVRNAAAILFAGSISYILVSGLPVGAVPDYLLLATLLAVSMPVARIIVELGAASSRPAGPRADAVAATTASLLVRSIGAAALVVAWLALPALVFAEDVGEQQFLWVYPLAAAGLTAAAAAGVLWLNNEAAGEGSEALVAAQPAESNPKAAGATSDNAEQIDPKMGLHEAPDLEALLPASLDGETVTTYSYTGDKGEQIFGGQASGEKSPIKLAGTTAEGVSVAVGGTSSIGIRAYRVEGVSGQALLDAAIGPVDDMGTATVTKMTIEGKDVYAVTSKETGETVYLYTDGDVLYAVGGQDLTDANLREVFGKLPDPAAPAGSPSTDELPPPPDDGSAVTTEE